jgi:hypothetical protein
MKDCPTCGAVVDGPTCLACGPKPSGAKGAPADPNWRLCSNVEYGQRCARAGTISHSTYGGGPWFCPQHFFHEHRTVAPYSGLRPLRELMSRAPQP